jgi:multicomponent Na+:H+ antiporter subunit E
MARIIWPAIVLLALWLLLSGIYKPMVVGFGVASVLIAVLVVRRMDRIDGDRIEIDLNWIRFARYIGWLMVEIAKANWAVTRIILSPEMRLRQHLFTTPNTQRTDLGQVIFANSITLTPGTITVETGQSSFLVHAVNYSEGDMDALADMDARVAATEGRGQ